jgi:hypothetical protein
LTGIVKEAAVEILFLFPITKTQYSIWEWLGSIYWITYR